MVIGDSFCLGRWEFNWQNGHFEQPRTVYVTCIAYHVIFSYYLTPNSNRLLRGDAIITPLPDSTTTTIPDPNINPTGRNSGTTNTVARSSRSPAPSTAARTAAPLRADWPPSYSAPSASGAAQAAAATTSPAAETAATTSTTVGLSSLS